jgi:antirestriction protein ArdC
MGGYVLKGEKSAPIAFFKSSYIDQNKKYIKPEIIEKMSSGEYKARGIQKIPVLKLYRVFNVA